MAPADYTATLSKQQKWIWEWAHSAKPRRSDSSKPSFELDLTKKRRKEKYENPEEYTQRDIVEDNLLIYYNDYVASQSMTGKKRRGKRVKPMLTADQYVTDTVSLNGNTWTQEQFEALPAELMTYHVLLHM